jgi:hypothetical protein
MDYFSRKSLSKYLIKKSYGFKSWFHKILCRYLVYCSPFSVAVESMQKMGRQTSPMFEIDLGVSVFCNLIGWYIYHHVGFKKEREAGLTLEGEEVALWRLTSISRSYYIWDFMSQDWEKINQKFVWLKVALINISRSTVPDCAPFLMVPFLFDIERN